MNDRDLLRLVHRAIALLGKVDENKPEESIRLIDTARDDLLEVRAELRTRVAETSAAGGVSEEEFHRRNLAVDMRDY